MGWTHAQFQVRVMSGADIPSLCFKTSGIYTVPLVENYQRVGESCCLYLQSQGVQNRGELTCEDGGRSVVKT